MKMRSLNQRSSLNRLEQLCRQRGIPLTVQRRVILEVLALRADHPTAEQIFEDVHARIPGLSRTTVYRVLEKLVQLGVARKAAHHDAVARFDGNTGRHHHLVCLHCDKMIDFDAPALNHLSIPNAARAEFEIVDYSVYFQGICPRCRRELSRLGRTRGETR
jgi:Fur family peroxide stress response transcriptional regulator